jgi:hypothetical protein
MNCPNLLLFRPALVILLAVGAGGCAADHAERSESSIQGVATTSAGHLPKRAAARANGSPSFQWPTPEGWRSETIPFPLEFAPELAYRGVEELRFAPKFFDASSPTYFTYSFVWLLEDGPAFGAAPLAHDLDVYFTGLARAVAPSKFEPKAHDARLEQQKDGTYRGVVHTVDAFGDGRALTLAVVGEAVTCGSHRGIVLSLSPRTDDTMWTTLNRQRRTFQCAV